MPTELKHDPTRGVTVEGKTVYYSLGSPHWKNMNRSPLAPATYHYSKPGESWDGGEMATMNLADWANDGKWSSALMRLDVALGFGKYEQSIKVGAGSGITTTFYLSEYDPGQDKPKDQNQEIDFEFAGHITHNVQTNVWWQGQQFPVLSPLWSGDQPNSLPDSTSRWGGDVYRYRIDWEPKIVRWSVDRSGSGTRYDVIRTQDMTSVGTYDESLCYPYMSFWTGWTPDGTKFQNGADAAAKCGESGPCYQAFYFQSLKFTPSDNNKLVTLVR